MTGLSFAQPQYVHGLWIVLVLAALLIGLERRRSHLLDLFIGATMQPRLVDRPGEFRRGLRSALLCLSMLAIVIALMRPQWGFEFIEAPRVGAEIMVALDVSRSMLAEDVAPNRLERSKAELRDLLPYLGGDQVGLIAFAGRASVLCPLTPDFGFLRVVLDNVDVGSVARGGTRLEEPIRKATAGFGTTGDLSRVILLFTDGEDHDSFPLDAAREAAERGIRIIVIGFGDENGSEIFVRDPQTGARTRVVDASGRPVMSRLDGDLLRELALTTEGAYIPAGTGVLDLESIFEAHIRPLMRAVGEKRGRTVQKDGFQWAILVALLALLGSAMSPLGRSGTLPVLLLALSLGGVPEARAQAPPMPAPDEEAEVVSGDEAGQGEARARIPIPEQPREAYNQGLSSLLADELDEGERLLESARGGAGNDGELRYRATFNLGWVEIKRADASMEAEPESALANLERSADWFREAIALRPADEEPRRNLEIVLRRALILADALAKADGLDLAARLDALIEEQRAAAASIRGVAETVSLDPDAHLGASARGLFKAAALEERQALSAAGALADFAGDELETLQDIGEEALSPEQRMRTFQLEALLGYLHRARESIGQARSQLRRKQALRAHRRASSGLSHLKRAREQLQNPVEILDGLLADASRVTTETGTLAAATTGLRLNRESGDGPAPEAPDWLDAEYLAEAQEGVTERAAELDAKLLAGLDQGAGEDPEQIQLLELLGAAQPHIARATGELAEAGIALHDERLVEAGRNQLEALAALAEAREQFLDLKGLVELAYTDESRIADVLEQAASEPEIDLAEFGPGLVALQERNLTRVQRMSGMVEQMRLELDAAAAQAEDPEPDEAAEAERKRLELADGILALSESTMQGAAESFGQLGDDPAAAQLAEERVGAALRGLDGLRRLFFTLIEHLRDAGQQQIDLGDATEVAPELDGEERGPESRRLQSHQRDLAQYTESLATALHEQSFADPAELAGGQPPPDAEAAQALAEKFVRAAEFVLAAADEMTRAADGIANSPLGEEASGEDEAQASEGREEEPAPPLGRDEIREHQSTAVQNILEALAALEPPPEEPDQGEEQEGDSGQQEQEQQSGAQEEEQESETSQDPGQLLQAVRDREAERHRNKNERNQSGYEPVDKDW